MARRGNHLTFTVVLVLAVFFFVTFLFSGPSSGAVSRIERLKPDNLAIPIKEAPPGTRSEFAVDINSMPASFLEGGSIAPKLENATLKAELGRSTWKFLHTMMAKFPEKPTKEDRMTLETFINLFGRLYPCGDCAQHFRELLAKYPPQTSSRNAAAGWLCFAHNVVNERLEKPIFDCNKIGDFYDCGCGDDKKKEGGEDANKELVKE